MGKKDAWEEKLGAGLKNKETTKVVMRYFFLGYDDSKKSFRFVDSVSDILT